MKLIAGICSFVGMIFAGVMAVYGTVTRIGEGFGHA